MGSSNNPGQVRQGYNPAMMPQPQMAYPAYGNVMPSYGMYQGMPTQPVGLPPVPYRGGINYPQSMMYNSAQPFYQPPVGYAQPNIVSYSPSHPFEMANYSIPQRASYIAPPQPQIPMIKDDSALIPLQTQPQPIVRRALTPPPVIRSQVTAFPEASSFFNPQNVQAAPIISQPPPNSEIINQQPIAPISVQMPSQPIQVPTGNIIQPNTILPTMNYSNLYQPTIPQTLNNYPQYISGAPLYQTDMYSSNLLQPQMIYSSNIPSNYMIPNQPYQLPSLNPSVPTTGMIPTEIPPTQIQAPIPPVPSNPRPVN